MSAPTPCQAFPFDFAQDTPSTNSGFRSLDCQAKVTLDELGIPTIGISHADVTLRMLDSNMLMRLGGSSTSLTFCSES